MTRPPRPDLATRRPEPVEGRSSTPTQLLLATNNAHKLTELRRMLAAAQLDITVLGLADVEPYPEPAETEPTFEGNAVLKARYGMHRTGLPTLADDSGLAVDLLNGMPGVRSARWSGPGASDEENNALLLRQLADVDAPLRVARFVCAMALVLPTGRSEVRRGEMAGRLLDELRGSNGFGYDPMFVPEGERRTYAEMAAAEKDAISHRGKALRLMIPVLADALA
ncbi:RdgB/HAM1 family non-canonical purine NTP pyrophosphatase [Microlunatus panaciterrae]|uniref:dITP/XTP pyrophosphatase n=1 Tax=Microlunatus panaciterrae TaxID=400768 RepID=A0ABS2RNR4_9ACTN|nr:RdgB/HAM1 family non-canonical purine NTP pyrophosphatase [Microlunatus panaciterrae]MBM7799816.1 XTP/dITP diphosphohydrolase [Microlunatus panaciterrae]